MAASTSQNPLPPNLRRPGLRSPGFRSPGLRSSDPQSPDPKPPSPQVYDQAYFDHWYRQEGYGSPSVLARKVGFAIGAVEYLTCRPVRSVLDIGCGEGAWQPALRKVRPDIRYLGIDPSTYAVERYGRERNLRSGHLGALDEVVTEADGPFDLIVCIDVLGYAPDDQVLPGLRFVADHLTGLALIEVFTAEDEFEGDVEHYRRRPMTTYRRWLARAGLERVGPNLFAGELVVPTLSSFEAPLRRR